MRSPIVHDVRECALEFTTLVVAGDFVAAFERIGAIYRPYTSPALLEEDYRRMIPADWGPMTHMEVDENTIELFTDIEASADVLLEDQPIDVAWVYVSLAGDVYPYSEAITLTVTLENNALRVIDVGFGRP